MENFIATMVMVLKRGWRLSDVISSQEVKKGIVKGR